MEKTIYYFKKPGHRNTEEVLRLAKQRAKELGIKQVVVASVTGKTALRAAEVFRGTGVKLTAVTYHAGYSNPDEIEISAVNRKSLEKKRVSVLMATHALSAVEKSFSKRFGAVSRSEAVGEALSSLFGGGMKTCVEILLMAADAGLISTSEEAIAIAGLGAGADTAIVALPSNSNRFFDLQVKEIICMPRGSEIYRRELK